MTKLALDFYVPVAGLSGLPGEVAAAVQAHEPEFRELFRTGGSAAEFAELGARVGARCGHRPERDGFARWRCELIANYERGRLFFANLIAGVL